VDFLLVLIEVLLLGVTAEALWAKIDRESATSLRRLHSSEVSLTKISGRRGSPPPIIIAWLSRPMNALQLCC